MIVINISNVSISILFEYFGRIWELEWYKTWALNERTIGFFELKIKLGNSL